MLLPRIHQTPLKARKRFPTEALILVGLLSILTSCAGAQPSLFQELGIAGRAEKPEETEPTEEFQRQATTEVRNPGFQDVNQGTGQPAAWAPLSGHRPILVSEPDGNGGTNYFARVANRNSYFQTVRFPVPTWQTITLVSQTRADITAAAPLYTLQTFVPQDEFPQADKYDNFSRGIGTLDWQPFYAPLTRLEDVGSFNIFLASGADVSWVDYDNFYMLTEEPKGGDFESEPQDWDLDNGASLITSAPLDGVGSLFLQPDAGASRLVAYSPHVVKYFAAGIADGDVTVEEVRLNAAGEIVDGSTSTTLSLSGPGFFYTELPDSPDGSVAQLRIENPGADSIRIDDISRGWAYAWPRVFEVAVNSPRPHTRLAAAWPANLDSAEIAILDNQGVERDRITGLERDDTSVWVYYSAPSLPAGKYTARFILQDGNRNTVTLDREFEKLIGAPYPDRPMGVTRPDFTRMAWMNLIDFSDLDDYDVDEAEARLAAAKEDGFNFLWISLLEDQYPVYKEAADRVGLPYMIYDPFFAGLFRSDVGNRTWDPSIVMDELDRFDVFLDSPHFEGIYIYDEPNGRDSGLYERTRDVMLMFERQDVYPRAYVFVNPYGQKRVNEIDLNLISTYEYPIQLNGIATPERLQWYFNLLEPHAQHAASIERDYWMGMQGYAGLQKAVTTTEETMAQLGLTLAIGSRGYFAFMYTTIGGFSSIRTFQNEPVKRTETFRRFNARVDALSDLLMSFRRERTAPPQENVIARVAEDQFGGVYTIVVNIDAERPVELLIETDSPTTVTNVETGALLQQEAPTSHTATLEAGNWAIYRFTDEVQPINVAGSFAEKKGRAWSNVQVVASVQGERALHTISLRPDSLYITGIDNTGALVYSLRPENPGEIVYRNTDVSMGSVTPGVDSGAISRYLDENRLVVASRRFGLFEVQQNDEAFTTLRHFDHITGGGGDLLEAGGVSWITQDYWGLVAGQLNEEGFDRSALLRPEEWGYNRLLTAYPDDSILVHEEIRGLYTMNLDENEIIGERVEGRRDNHRPPRMSPGGRVAIPTIDQGVKLFRVDKEKGGVIEEAMLTDDQLVESIGVAWLSEDTLAVADPRFGVRFYREFPKGTWRRMGLWKPASEPFVILDIDSNGDGLMAATLLDGTILLADVDEVVNGGRQNGWIAW